MTGTTRFTVSVLVFLLFAVFIVLPFTGIPFPILSEAWFSRTYLGVVHLPSLAFIGGSFGVYCVFAPIEVRANQLAKVDLTLKSLREAQSMLQAINRPAGRDEVIPRFLQLSESNVLVRIVKVCVQRAMGEEAMRQHIASKTDTLAHKHQFLYRYWNQVASTLPLLGMTGTIAGLLFMFNDTTFSDDRSSQLAGLGVALLTTLYSSLITVLVTKQLSKSAADNVAAILFASEEVVRVGSSLTRIVRPRDVQQAQQHAKEVA